MFLLGQRSCDIKLLGDLDMLESAFEPREIDFGKQHESSVDNGTRWGNAFIFIATEIVN